MYQLLAKQHKNYVTPISHGYQFINSESNSDWDIILIEESESKKEILISFENILTRLFDADFDINFDYYVNNELVYSAGDYECIIDGIYFYIFEKEDNMDNYSEEWEKLNNPVDDNISIFIKENNDYGFDIIVDDKYLMCLSSLPILDNKLIGRKIFWLDPCALKGFEHTSGFYKITYIDEDECTITLENDTEVYINECYM